ncbi:hypothetical protein [Methanoplanus limicola]|uniref:Uncharacterized protein n=1 Tax=Methanoplanus limicola DSM 2279 TaxID=937775 RepID=H1Z1L0_9EURY|nr:hypothetical protein [Methanoplanus limicola]EHQ34536.1 hypothetical protein Metlim_0396 [Methanoplanus limicola DSM 2279]
MEINEHQRKKIVELIMSKVDLRENYKDYSWNKDSWKNGYPNICRLELMVSNLAKERLLDKECLIEIAQWGGLPKISNIRCDDYIRISLYDKETPSKAFIDEPDNAVSILQSQIKGFGPTYLTKLLRFAVPKEFGALDTRIVRVFGIGDNNVSEIQLLNLRATNYNGRWAILKTQPGWPSEYGNWIAILKGIADELNRREVVCPHPEKMVYYGLRNNGEWTVSDVEMGLFAYASKKIMGI